MNLLFFILIFSLAGLLISAASSYVFIYNVISQRAEIIRELSATIREQEIFKKLLQSLNIHDQIEELADEKLDRLVENFKAKVPMVGMFLAGDLEITLKQLAKVELLSMIPEIEKNIIVKQEHLYANMEKQLSTIDYKKFICMLIRLQLPSLFVGVALGAAFGVILFLRPN